MNSSLIDDGSFYKRFFHEGEYGIQEGWPHSTTLLYRMRIKTEDKNDFTENIRLHKLGYSLPLQCERWIKIENDSRSNRHAEMVFMQEIDALFDGLKEEGQPTIRQVSFDIVLSYSPCSDCAIGLIQLKRKIEQTRKNFILCTMNIKFANFYKHFENENIKAMIMMVQNQVELSVFNGLCDWKDFLDNIVKLSLDIQSEEFYKTWLSRQNRELVDSILLKCIKFVAFQWPWQSETDRGNMIELISSVKSVQCSFECLKGMKRFEVQYLNG